MHTTNTNRYDTIVIGGGQAGLAAGYQLRNAGRSFLVLDAGKHPGDSWRRRWDSLRLFSPAQYDGLPGLRFPAPSGTFPTKDEMADYLERYVGHFELPILHEMRVTKVTKTEHGMSVECGEHQYCCKNVIVAVGAYASPRVPDFATALDPSIVQLHSSEYRRPDDLPPGRVLVVGFGTSGVEIAANWQQLAARCSSPGDQHRRFFQSSCQRYFLHEIPCCVCLARCTGTSCIEW